MNQRQFEKKRKELEDLYEDLRSGELDEDEAAELEEEFEEQMFNLEARVK